MNGRCTADPLDHADDICEFCGDEFCRSCLIATRSGKGQLICRECAISNSGIKGSKSHKPRASRAQVERARVVLAEAKGTRTAKTFQFFDETEGYVAPDMPVASATVDEEPEEAAGRGSKRRFALRRKTDDDENESFLHDAEESDADTTPPPPSVPTGRSTPATTLIESGALAGSPPGLLPTSQLSPEASTAPDPRWPLAGEMTGVSLPSNPNDAAVDPSPGVDNEVPSVDGRAAPSSLADRLRTAPPPVSHSAPTPRPAAPSFAPVEHHTGQAGFAAEHLDLDPFAIADAPSTGFGGDPAVAAPFDLSFPTTQGSDPFATASASFEWHESSEHRDGGHRAEAGPTVTAVNSSDLLDDPFASAPAGPAATTPSATAPRQRAADQFQPPFEAVPERRSEQSPPSAPAPVSRLAAPPAAMPIAMPVVPSPPQRCVPQPAPVPASANVAKPAGPTTASATIAAAPVSTSADTDANGNWIPPLLRGMAPVAERRADQLPRRRQRD